MLNILFRRSKSNRVSINEYFTFILSFCVIDHRNFINTISFEIILSSFKPKLDMHKFKKSYTVCTVTYFFGLTELLLTNYAVDPTIRLFLTPKCNTAMPICYFGPNPRKSAGRYEFFIHFKCIPMLEVQ